MLDVFKKMSRHILDRLGEDALFDGASEPVKINIEYGVAFDGIDGERANTDGQLVVHKDVATIESRHNPKKGQIFTLDGKRWRLDYLVHDNGVAKRFVIMPIP